MAFAAFSASVTEAGGRIVEVYPDLQIVVFNVAVVTFGLSAPGVHALSSSGSLAAVYPKWHDPAGGWTCTVYFACGPGPYCNAAGAPPFPGPELPDGPGAGVAGCLALSEEVPPEQPVAVTASSSETAVAATRWTAIRGPPRQDGDTVTLPPTPQLVCCQGT
ncbi:hypothetical protein ACIBL5_36445 [Streptomyces sp. NPDC050516]|uniref:hypothetical protein n=1 Tax=Streptomyces sp. NPDC050516 TaxID=3365621 RepID=UPI0037947E69